MNRRLVLIALPLLLLAAGCSTPVVSQQPLPSHYPVATQPTFMAQAHWRDHAEQVAAELLDNPSAKAFVSRGLHLRSHDETPFGRVFAAQLAAALNERGAPVVPAGSGVPSLDYEVMLVRHGDIFRETTTGTYKTLAPGFALEPGDYLHEPGAERREAQGRVRDARVPTEAGALQDEPQYQELVVSCVLSLDGSELFRDAEGFYVPHADWPLYSRARDLYDPYAPKEPGPAPGTKNYTLVNEAQQ